MSELRPVVVLIEDEPQIRRFLRAVLPEHGYVVFEADTGRQGIVEAGVRKADVVVLDLGLPDMDGKEVIRRIREWSAMPIIILSARAQEEDKIAALDAGADDYVTKPFSVGELLARLRVALRHQSRSGQGDERFEHEGLVVDLAGRRIELNGEPVHLTPIEFRLLSVLVRHAGRVLTHRQLLREVWGPSHAEDAHYLRIYMAQLRRKLERDPAQPAFLLTEPGVGYRLAAD